MQRETEPVPSRSDPGLDEFGGLKLEPTLGELADQYHEHPDLPPGRLPNGLWKCIGCGVIVGRRGRWLNWCSDCGYDEWD